MFEFSAHWHSASNIYNNINNKYYCIPLLQADLAYDFLKCLYFPPLLIWYVLCRMFFLSLPFDSLLSWKFVCHEDFFLILLEANISLLLIVPCLPLSLPLFSVWACSQSFHIPSFALSSSSGSGLISGTDKLCCFLLLPGVCREASWSGSVPWSEVDLDSCV